MNLRKITLPIFIVCGIAQGAYVPQVAQESGITEVFLAADGGTIVLPSEVASFCSWIKNKVSKEQGMSKDLPLSVPVPLQVMLQIKYFLTFSIKNMNDGQLQSELLSKLDTRAFADLLIYSWFLKADNLLFEAGPKFIKRLLENHLDEFVEQKDYLSTIFVADGKPAGVDWQLVITQLKLWLTRYALSLSEIEELRAKCCKRIDLPGHPVHANHAANGCLTLSGVQEAGGFCELLSLDNDAHLTESTEYPVLGSFFLPGPFVSIIDGASVRCFDLISRTSKQIPLVDSSGSEAIILSVAQSSDGRKLALGAGADIIILDSKTGQIMQILVEAEPTLIASTILAFIPNSPVLVDIRSSEKRNVIHLWHTQTGTCLLSKEFEGSGIMKYCCTEAAIFWGMTAKGMLIRLDCSLTDKGELRFQDAQEKIWDPAMNSKEGFNLLKSTTRPICFHPMGGRIVVAQADGMADVLDMSEDGKHITRLKDAQTIEDGCYGSNNLLATLDKRQLVCLWDDETGERLVQVTLNQPGCLLGFGPRNDYLLLGTGDSCLALYFSNQFIEEYLSKKLTLEQQLVLLLWLRNKAISHPHLQEQVQSLDERVRRFVQVQHDDAQQRVDKVDDAAAALKAQLVNERKKALSIKLAIVKAHLLLSKKIANLSDPKEELKEDDRLTYEQAVELLVQAEQLLKEAKGTEAVPLLYKVGIQNHLSTEIKVKAWTLLGNLYKSGVENDNAITLQCLLVIERLQNHDN